MEGQSRYARYLNWFSTEEYYDEVLDEIKTDLDNGMQRLSRLCQVDNKKTELPIAFATNTLYVLARHGLMSSADKLVQDRLLPLV